MSESTSQKLNSLFESLGIKKEEQTASAGYLFAAAAFLILFCLPFFTFLNAWVFLSFWNWFLVPVGFATISFPIALGIVTLIGFLKFRTADLETDEEKTAKYLANPIRTVFTDTFLMTLIRIMTTYFMGWIISLFV